MLTQQVALVAELKQVSPSELTRVGAALQKQAIRDFGPIWDVKATVDPFVRLEDVPLGYWPIIVEANIEQEGALGVHMDHDGQPFALVEYTKEWSLTASHEMLEMLADPFGNRLVPGDSPMEGQGRVEFLVEVSDPSEASDYAYTVNGVMMSDFYTPNYFDPVAAPGVRYSYRGAITKPREVLPGGYLSWHDIESDHWWQAIYFGRQLEFRDLGVLTGKMKGSIRATIDSMTKGPEFRRDGIAKRDNKLTAMARLSSPTRSSNAKAQRLRSRIAELMK